MSSFQKINYKLDFIIQFRTHSEQWHYSYQSVSDC